MISWTDPSAGEPADLVRIAGLGVDYGERRAIDAVHLLVPPGEVFGLLGPNGAGKTTIGSPRLAMGHASAKGILAAGVLWIAGFALVLGLINLLLTSTLVPTPETRARCRHLIRASCWNDGRNSLPWVVLLSLFAAVAWCMVVRTFIQNTSALQGIEFELINMLWVTVSLVVPALAAHALVLWSGWKVAGFALWLILLMIAVVGALMSVRPDGWPMWVAGMSGLVLPALCLVRGSRWIVDGELPGSLPSLARATRRRDRGIPAQGAPQGAGAFVAGGNGR